MDRRLSGPIVLLGIIIVFFLIRHNMCPVKTREINTNKAAIEKTGGTELEKLEIELEYWQKREKELKEMLEKKMAAGESGNDIRPSYLEAKQNVEEILEEIAALEKGDGD